MDDMRIYKLGDLPVPPKCRTGWPWTTEVKQFPPLASSGKPWPKISIVTPSYNQGQFLEETIRSVLLQGYPNLEYIIMDGGSTDNSVGIIKKYEPWLTSWVSEKDNGQADAIYRGFELCTGDIIGWVNSDDILLFNALFEFGHYFSEHRDAELVVGGAVLINERSEIILHPNGSPTVDFGDRVSYLKLRIMQGMTFHQPATMWKRTVFFDVGGFDRSLFFCFDFDLYFRLTKRKTSHRLKKGIAAFRIHDSSKTSTQNEVRIRENSLLFEKYNLGGIPTFLKNILRFYYIQARRVSYRIDLNSDWTGFASLWCK